MAGESGSSPRALGLLDALAREPWRFDFFQAVRRLECAHPERPRIGRSSRAAEDPVRLGQEPSTAFAPSTLAAFRRPDGGGAPRLSVHFLGLLGPGGPLPLHLTEYVRQRERVSGDSAPRRFLDLLHHRMLSFFYRAWASSRPAVHWDRPAEDRFSLWVGALMGLGTPALKDRDHVPDRAKLHEAGRFASQCRNAEGLEAILAEYLGVPVRLEPFRGRWLDIPEDGRWRLGESPDTGTLGVSSTVGSRVWDREQSFRLILGPLGLADYRRFLPGADSLARLADLTRLYVGDSLCWDLNLVLRREDVPPVRLGGDTALGVDAWLTSRTPEHDPDDLVLHPAPGG